MAKRRSHPRLRTLAAALLTFAASALTIVLLSNLPWWWVPLTLVLVLLWMTTARSGRQAWSVTEVGIATIPQRLGSCSVVIVGIAGVVGVLVALLALVAGFQATLAETGSTDSAIVLRAGAQTELNSVLDHDTTSIVMTAPQVRRDAQGEPIASAEMVVVASLPKKSNGLDANVEIRGVGAHVWELRPDTKIIAGRKFTLGLRELIVGKSARQQFAGIDLGSTLTLNHEVWTVVGVFDAGDSHDSEVWGDADVVAPTYRRGSSSTAVSVQLTDAGAFDAFKALLKSDPRLTVDVKTTRAYYSDQSAQFTKLMRAFGVTIATIMAIGAVFGALNTMYAAVATRAREIATLRAIGFGGAPVIVAVLLETMLLAVLGGALGAAVAWLLFNHYTASTLGANFTQVVFAFEVSAALVWLGLKWALAIGAIGGMFPAVRAARMPVTAGLREL